MMHGILDACPRDTKFSRFTWWGTRIGLLIQKTVVGIDLLLVLFMSISPSNAYLILLLFPTIIFLGYFAPLIFMLSIIHWILFPNNTFGKICAAASFTTTLAVWGFAIPYLPI